MRTELSVFLTKTYTGKPLAVVDGLPGGGAELTPAELRALAASLLRIAADCESRPVAGKHYTTARKAYTLTAS